MRSVYAIDTPFGKIHAVEQDGRVVLLLLPGFAPPEPEGRPQTNLAEELSEYFSGARKSFTVPIAAHGPDFFKAVWKATLAVPPGTTATYAEVAARAGRPGAARAAGQALAKNPLPILIPCHRVVYTHGGRHRYLGGEEMKKSLLRLEGGQA